MSTPERTAREVDDHEAVDHLARAGLVAYGVIHILVAVLAIRLALGTGGGSASQQGALQEVARQPFGGVLVWAVTLGLVCMALWRAEEATIGHRDLDGGERIRKRVASGFKAVVYGAVAVTGVKVAVGAATSGSDQASDTWTARLLDLPGGQVVVVVLGLAVVGAGLYLGWQGVSGAAGDKLDAEGRSGETGRALHLLGSVGYVAKGVSVALVGGLFAYAGITHDPERSGGLDQALHTVLQQPFGVVLLLVVAAGLGAYGIFSLARARHLDR